MGLFKNTTILILYTLPNAIRNCRRYGIRGILEYGVRQMKRRARERQFFLNSSKSRIPPADGITVAAYLLSQGSLSKVARDFIHLLRQAEIPFQTFDVAFEGREHVPACDQIGIVTPEEKFVPQKYKRLISLQTGTFDPKQKGVTHARIAFWEFESGFAESYPNLCHGGDLIAFSDFDYEVFKASVSKETSVWKILYPFRFPDPNLPDPLVIRQKYGIPRETFAVFFNFDFNNSFARKNPDGVIRAFAEGLGSVPNARLVFKTQCAKLHPTEVQGLQELANALGIGDRLVFVHDFISQRDLYGLTNACDVYISLHRGEGFGLGIAEAMSLGKAVVVTNYSAPTEFCKEDNCMLIPYEMVDVRPEQVEQSIYSHVKQWAEPDVHSAANALRRLYDNPELRIRLGDRAASFMREHYSCAKFRESVWKFIRHQ